MSKDHVPDGKTQSNLFVLRSRARTAEIERRSTMGQSIDIGEEGLDEAVERRDRNLHKQSVKRLNNAEHTIVALLRNSEAFQKTIDRLTDAWGEDKDKAMGFAQEVLDKTCQELDEDYAYKGRAQAWAQEQMAADNKRSVGRPKIKKP